MWLTLLPRDRAERFSLNFFSEAVKADAACLWEMLPFLGHKKVRKWAQGIMIIHSCPLKNHYSGLPWWRSDWESVCQCRERGFKPWSGKIPHAAEQLGPWATTTEPARPEPVLRNERGRDSERPAHRDEEWPPLAITRESPRTETKTQHSHKLKNKNKKKEPL